MNVLIAAIFYPQILQSYSIFVESIKNLDLPPKKTILFDLFEQKKLDSKLVEDIIEIRSVKKEENFMEQISKIRNEALKEARKGNFDALLFTLTNIFPPEDILRKLGDSKKDVIAPAFYNMKKNVIFSNALKKVGPTTQKHDLKVLLFEELLPSGVYPVFSVSLESVFLRKSTFDFLEFESVQTALEEMVSFSEQIKKQNKEVFVDSSTVCSKLSPMQLMSYYYFKSQKLSEKYQN